VELEVVVRADGTVGATRVIRRLHTDLDEAAINAVRRWKFKPGTVHGSPVPMAVTIELTFVLR
jgi:TonB family protein